MCHFLLPKINMQFPVLVMLVAVLTATLSGKEGRRASLEGLAREVAIYDDDAGHIWNRVHATFFLREDLPGTELLPDALDPPFWYHTSYLLAQPSHNEAVHVLDEFLQKHAENLIHDPVKRAMLQRDLWAVFDWSAGRASGYETERRELQARLAEVLRRFTATPDDCWFCLWEGYDLQGTPLTTPGGPSVPRPDPLPSAVRNGPRVRLPHRDYLLYSGTVEDVVAPVPSVNPSFSQTGYSR